MSARIRKRTFDVLRIAVCVAALWIVLRGVTLRDRILLRNGQTLTGRLEQNDDIVVVALADGTRREIVRSDLAVDPRGEPRIQIGLATAIRDAHKALLFLAVLIHFPVGFIQALRLQWLLRVQGISLSYWQNVKLSFAGNFLNFATPLGSNAGDVFKAYFVTTHTDHKTEAAATIVLDRVIGLGTLLICVALITLLASHDPRLARVQPYVLTMLAIAVVAAAAYFAPVVRRRIPLDRMIARWSFLSHVHRVDQTIRLLASRMTTLLGAVLLTVALQVLAISAYFTVAVALCLDAHLGNVLEFFAYFYTGAVIQALPGPPQGLGTVELAYRYFFDPFGSPAQIVCLALLARVVVLVCALPGLWVTLTGGYRPKAPVSDATRFAASRTRPVADHDLAPPKGLEHVR